MGPRRGLTAYLVNDERLKGSRELTGAEDRGGAVGLTTVEFLTSRSAGVVTIRASTPR